MELSQILVLTGAISLFIGIVVGYFIFKIRLNEGRGQLDRQPFRRDGQRTLPAAQQRLRDLYNLISTLTATLKYQRVLDMALDLSTNVLTSSNTPTDRLVSAVLLFSDIEKGKPKLTVGSARRFTPADMRIVLPVESGMIARVFESGEGVLAKEVAKDPELSRIVAVRACNVAYGVPLRAGLDTYGVLLFAHPDQNFFSQASREALDIIAHQAVIAIQNARLYSDLEQEKNRMMEIQEEARKKLARDLHDGPTQSIAAIAMRINFARRLMERDAKAAGEELQKIEDLARRTTKEIRHMLFTLRPLVLESQGLVAALDQMAEKMHDTYEQNVIIEADPKIVPEIEINKQTIIFYIAEEAITNARKHAKAAHVYVRLRSVDSDLALLEIADDGVGFNVGAMDDSYDQRGSLGMVNMRERAELVSGVLTIDSKEGEGTRIQVLIPLSEEGIDRLRRGL